MQPLVNGAVPANTDCPYKNRCELAQSDSCNHTGVNHAVPFSCAVARGFEIILRNKEFANYGTQNN